MIDLLKKHKILIRYLIVILSVLGIISRMYIQKINDEKPYKPQHELDWYYEVMSEYFRNISVDCIDSGPVYYFSDKPGISASTYYYPIDNAFDENSELRSDLDHTDYVRTFNQTVNQLYYASLVYDDFVDYINSIIPEGMNYKLEIVLSTNSGDREITEFTPEAAWMRLKNEEHRYFLLYWLVETDDEYEEFDLQESLNELLQYTKEYFKSREVMLAISMGGAEMENIDEYQEYLLREWFNNIDSLVLNRNVQDESQ